MEYKVDYSYVIDKTTSRLKRCGYSNFTIDDETEVLLDYHKYVPLQLETYYYKWNGTEFIEDGIIDDDE